MKVSLPAARVFSSSTFTSTIYQTGFAWTSFSSSDMGIITIALIVKS